MIMKKDNSFIEVDGSRVKVGSVEVGNGKVSVGRKSRSVFWGAVLILAAVVLIMNGVGIEFGYGITPWRIIAGVLLAAWLIYEIVRLKFTDLFFPLAFLFIVFQSPLANALNMESDTIVSPWIILLAALLLTVGFKMIFKPKHIININGKDIPFENAKDLGGKVGSETLYLDASDLSNVVIRDHIGTSQIYISNRESYDGNGKITVCDNLGLVVLHIPNEWNVVTHSSDNLGKITIPPHESENAKSILLVVTDNLGKVEVVFD